MNNPESPSNTSDKSFLPKIYKPAECDVICGRCGTSLHHSGNKAFRKSIANSLELYTAASTRRSKTIVVSDIANKLLFNGDESLRFVQFCGKEHRWYELPYEAIRLKVGQALLDYMIQRDPERRLKQKHSQQRCRLRRKDIPSDIARKTIDPSGENGAIASPSLQPQPVVSESLSLQDEAPSERELRSILRVDVAPGVSSFCDAHMNACERSTAECRQQEEDSADECTSTGCGWFTDAEGRIYLKLLV
ncbi:hypothetical protein MHU86_4665 [Fragilaria crotonensis]|nr:hypothetical protein MHU86_4665 [Fragilaria crotonensis]